MAVQTVDIFVNVEREGGLFCLAVYADSEQVADFADCGLSQYLALDNAQALAEMLRDGNAIIPSIPNITIYLNGREFEAYSVPNYAI